MTMLIPLNKGLSAIIDDEDFTLVVGQTWVASVKTVKSGGFYALAWHKGLKRSISMHRLILDAGAGRVVDHINGDGLDNRRSNLRFANRSLNGANRGGFAPKSGFRGVYPTNDRGRPFFARISIHNRNVYLGRYDTAELAAKAYDQAAQDAFGEFARLNFPDHSAVALVCAPRATHVRAA